MKLMCIDIGNTNIKFCKVNKNFKIIKTYFFQTKKLGLEKDISQKLKRIVNNNTNQSGIDVVSAATGAGSARPQGQPANRISDFNPNENCFTKAFVPP